MVVFLSHTLKQFPFCSGLDNLQQLYTRYGGQRPLASIFLGGGTPSLFSGQAMHKLLQHINNHYACVDNIEITLEANPGTIDTHYFAEYRAAGINRVSLGAQSFHAAHLKHLGRIHNPDEIYRAIEVIKKIGFPQFNLDIMYGLPGQSLDAALDDLQQAINTAPPHISWYQLTLEPGTAFAKRPPRLPQDETLWQMTDAGTALLATQLYTRYEISAYAKTGAVCQHNLNYWQFGDYLGIGAGAHSKVNLSPMSIVRLEQTKNPKNYLAGKDAELWHVPKQDILFEFMLNHLRLRAPVDVAQLIERTGVGMQELEHYLLRPDVRALLTLKDNQLHKTKQGELFLNDLQAAFLPAGS